MRRGGIGAALLLAAAPAVSAQASQTNVFACDHGPCYQSGDLICDTAPSAAAVFGGQRLLVDLTHPVGNVFPLPAISGSPAQVGGAPGLVLTNAQDLLVGIE